MKKCIVVLTLLTCSPFFVSGQISLRDSASNTTALLYAGILAGPKLVLDGSTSSFATLRSGGLFSWSPTKRFSFSGLAAAEFDASSTMTPFTLFGVKIEASRRLSVTIGKIATPMTEQRPVPVTAAGQFEPWTRARILGSAIGAKVAFTATKDLTITGGSFRRKDDVSLEAKIQYKKLSFSGYQIVGSQSFGAAFTLATDPLLLVVQYNHRKDAGVMAFKRLSTSHSISMYCDVGYTTTDSWKRVRAEAGFTKSISLKSLKAILGIGYAEEIQSIKGYVFLSL